LISRSTKEEFLGALEAWMNEIVAKNADGHNESIPDMVKGDFHLSMKANAQFHGEVASTLQGDSEKTLAQYHCLMSDIYKMLMCN
jgi:hypothetical protein